MIEKKPSPKTMSVEEAAATFRAVGEALALRRVAVEARTPLPPKPKENQLPLVVRFGAQVVVGALVFSIIAGVAEGLNRLVDWLELHESSQIIIQGLRGVELLLFGADMLCFVIFILVETTALIRAMVEGFLKKVSK